MWRKYFPSFIGGCVGTAVALLAASLLSLSAATQWAQNSEGLAAWIAIIVSSVGLAFLYIQLKATRNAADAARKAAEIALAETRPWLEVIVQENAEGFFNPTANMMAAHICLEVTNVGKTPATHVEFHWRLLTTIDDEDLLAVINGIPQNPLLGRVLFPGAKTGFGGQGKCQIPVGDPGNIRGVCVVTYQSPGGMRHMTPLLIEEFWTPEVVLPVGERKTSVVMRPRKVLQPT